MKNLIVCILFFIFNFSLEADIIKDISYYSKTKTDYQEQRCKLDIYQPKSTSASPALIWFHGGGLKSNSKDKEDEVVLVAKHYMSKGITFIAVNYRLSPKVNFPLYVYDAAASIKWVIGNASSYNINKDKVFVGGHSAGGYLTFMATVEGEATKACGLKVNDIAGIIPISGQTVTHTTVKGETNSKGAVVCDERAPLYHYKKMKRPMLLITADNDLKMRIEENELLFSAIKKQSSGFSEFLCFNDRNHVSIMTKMSEKNDPAFLKTLEFIKAVSK